MTDDQYYTDLVSVVATVTVGYGVALGRARAALAEQRSRSWPASRSAERGPPCAQEQARIAREVHDIVAHDMSVMVAQAACRPPGLRRPGRGTAVERACVHRRASAGSPRRPSPAGDLCCAGRARVRRAAGRGSTDSRRCRQVERAGVPVELVIRGSAAVHSRRPWNCNAYRIVQEALTNVLKHAGPARAVVVLEYGGDHAARGGDRRRRPGDRGRAHRYRGVPAERGTQATTGYGLVGMQQRATMLGGDLVAGPGRLVAAAAGTEAGRRPTPARGLDRRRRSHAGHDDHRPDRRRPAAHAGPRCAPAWPPSRTSRWSGRPGTAR